MGKVNPTNYMESGTHFFTTFDQILECLKYPSAFDRNYLIEGLINTQNSGYVIAKRYQVMDNLQELLKPWGVYHKEGNYINLNDNKSLADDVFTRLCRENAVKIQLDLFTPIPVNAENS